MDASIHEIGFKHRNYSLSECARLTDFFKNDYYLRLTGNGAKVLRGEQPVSDELPSLQELGISGR